MSRRTKKKHGAGQHCVKDFRLADEVRYIQNKAAEHDGRVVSVGQLVLFSTDTGDAWLLDVTDQLAAPLARDGDPEPIHLEETDTSFAIGWKGHYHIEGTAFIYADRDSGQVRTIFGYPTQKIARAG
ncbi:MAG: hypothetical protein WCA20_12710 [Candidatus Sulfotelmatobacter sp.]